MGTLAPPVVAVVVAHDPGPWFEETLASLAAQDYEELSVLVLDASGEGDLTVRVASVLPTAYVRRFEENRGFGATANEVRTMVDGAAYYLFCHDDVALFPDTVHLLVEEAFRSNAGIVGPKIVDWGEPQRLVHVGMTIDKGGAVVDRVHAHEIDHGQHDAVRDVFLAPGGCTLVRADLFEVLGGFDPSIVAMGEDLDLCWRAHVAGARIIVAPDARVRHLEEVASGRRPLEELATPAIDRSAAGSETTGNGGETGEAAEGESDGAPPSPVVTLQQLQRRHELLCVLKCYGRFHLLRVLPQVAVLAAAEVSVALVAGSRARARAVVAAWRWNLGRLGTLRRQRAELHDLRRLGDKEIRSLQLGGSARLSAYARRVFQLGFHGAHADEIAGDETEPSGARTDELLRLEAAEASAAAVAPSPSAPASQLSSRARLVAWLAATLIVVIGMRGVLTGRLPAIGQFTPFPGWSSTFGQFFAGWHPSGVGTTAPAAPALAIAGVVGTVLLGAMGLAQKVLVFACIPLGAWGMVRVLRPFGSTRAGLVAGIAYLAMAVPYDALALGRWGALVVYAGGPWVLARLFAATCTPPFAPEQGEAVPRRLAGAFFSRHPAVGSMLALGVLEAVLVSFVPAAAFVVVLVGVALVLSSSVFGDWRETGRALGVAVGATVVAGLVCLPWLIGVLSAGTGALSVLGTPTPTSGAPSWGSLLRFAAGPIGDSPLAWGFVVAAAVPLVIARGARFRWAARAWSIALVCWVAAWVIGRGWTGKLAVDTLVLLAPAAAAAAAAIGLGIAAFEEDLRRRGVRLAPAGPCGGDGRGRARRGAHRRLGATWTLRPPGQRLRPVGRLDAGPAPRTVRSACSGSATRGLSTREGGAPGDGLAYATSENGAPDARWLWNAASAGPAATMASAVDLARTGDTDRLGHLLAPASVRYVVLLTAVAPEISGEQSPESLPVPSDLAPALARQLDLRPVIAGTGITVYQNAGWIPQRTEASIAAASAPATALGDPTAPIVAGAKPVLPGPAAATGFEGRLGAGTVLSAAAPAGRFALATAGGHRAPLDRLRMVRELPGDRTGHRDAVVPWRGARRHRGNRLGARLVARRHAAALPGADGGGICPVRASRRGRRRGPAGGRRGAARPARGDGTVMPPDDAVDDQGGEVAALPSVSRRPGRPPVAGRKAVVVSVFAVAAGVAAVAAAAPVPAPAPAVSAGATGVPPGGAHASSAFCSAGAGTAAVTIYLTNSSPRSVDGVMTTVGAAGGGSAPSTTRRAVQVPALGTAAVNPSVGLPSGSTATTFAFAGGGVSADQVVAGPSGWSTAPCASQVGARWTFAGGSTTAGNTLTLSLLNPSAAAAVVNVSFLTAEGLVTPQAYQGLAVGAGELVVENVGDYVQNTAGFATVVASESGSVVADELQKTTGSVAGLSLNLGAPLSTSWGFAQTNAPAGSTVQFAVGNPGTGPVSVTFSASLPAATVTPRTIVVPPQSSAAFDASHAAGWPLRTPYRVSVAATGPVVVGRSVAAPGGTQPSWGSLPATPTAATGWLVPGPGVPHAPGVVGATATGLALADPGRDPAQVVVAALGGATVATLTVAPGSVSVLGQAHVGGLRVLTVRASVPVLVEEDSGPSAAPGVVASTGFPSG